MKFEKLNENSVRCIVSQEDLEENGLTIEDFVMNQDKVRDFISELVLMAKEEVGYEVNDEALAVQLVTLPRNRLAITLTNNAESSIRDMLEHLKGDVNEVTSSEEEEELLPEFNSEIDSIPESKNSDKPVEEAKQDTKKKSVAQQKVTSRVYEFKSLEEVEQLATSITIQKSITSRLFKDRKENRYYLVINKGRLSKDVYRNICEQALDFGVLYSYKTSQLAYIEEHFECLIKKKAIDVLQTIARVK